MASRCVVVITGGKKPWLVEESLTSADPVGVVEPIITPPSRSIRIRSIPDCPPEPVGARGEVRKAIALPPFTVSAYSFTPILNKRR